jgi:uncharacterized protein
VAPNEPRATGSIPRLVPDLVLPPYTFVPGGPWPHPTGSPRGHSFGPEAPVPAPPDPDRWHECRPYLCGLDLFNHGFYWESHVQWESLWLACGRTGLTADFLKGLIKLAAAGVKHLEGMPEGVRSHGRRADELWRRLANVRGPEPFMGFAVDELCCLAEGIALSGWPAQPMLLLPKG